MKHMQHILIAPATLFGTTLASPFVRRSRRSLTLRQNMLQVRPTRKGGAVVRTLRQLRVSDGAQRSRRLSNRLNPLAR